MLNLIGLGLADGDVSERALERLENCEAAFAEFYTNSETVDLERLEQRTGTEIKQLERSEVEQDLLPVEEAEEGNVAFLVSGDPLAATTHFQLKHEARSRGIEVEVFHAPSILTAVSETGLNLYRFGRTVTMPADSTPGSLADQVEDNDSIGLHTLVLLDIDLDASRAAEKLMELRTDWSDREAVVLERAGLESQSITRATLEEIAGMETGEPPHCIALTGDTTHKEQEFLEGPR